VGLKRLPRRIDDISISETNPRVLPLLRGRFGWEEGATHSPPVFSPTREEELLLGGE
jgi:hypothetical protein